MSVSNTFKLHAIVTPDAQINQVTARRIDPGIQRMLVGGNGVLTAQMIVRMSQRPLMSITTTAVKRVLDMISMKGKAYTAAACNMYFGKKDAGGALVAGANHLQLDFNRSLWIPRTLRASQDGPAEIDVDIYAISANGTASPLTVTNSVSLPSLTAADQLFTLGPAKFNGGSLIGTLRELSLNFGISERLISGSGEEWPTFGSIDKYQPSVRLSCYDLTQLASPLTVGGLAVSSATKAFLRAKSQEGGNVADATTSHLSWTMTTLGTIDPGMIDESDDGESMLNIDWTAGDDGTNDPLIYGSAVAIS